MTPRYLNLVFGHRSAYGLQHVELGVHCVSWQIWGELYLLWKGDQLLSKILIVAVILKYLCKWKTEMSP